MRRRATATVDLYQASHTGTCDCGTSVTVTVTSEKTDMNVTQAITVQSETRNLASASSVRFNRLRDGLAFDRPSGLPWKVNAPQTRDARNATVTPVGAAVHQAPNVGSR